MLKRGLFWRTLFAILLSFLLVGCGGSNPQQRSSKQGSTQTSQAKPQMDKKTAYAEINALLDLDLVKKEQDKVGRTNFYKPFTGLGLYPSWQVTQTDNTVRMDAIIMDGAKRENSKGPDSLVYWHTIIFSTDEKKWEYQIPNCDGNTGGGKKVSTNNKRIYEYYKTPFNELSGGYRLLVEGTNPTIRLKGVNKRKDIKVTKEMIEALKTGLRLDELFIITHGQIERPQ